MEVHRGEVFYADLSPVVGSEQGGVRPVLIVQNEISTACGSGPGRSRRKIRNVWIRLWT